MKELHGNLLCRNRNCVCMISDSSCPRIKKPQPEPGLVGNRFAAFRHHGLSTNVPAAVVMVTDRPRARGSIGERPQCSTSCYDLRAGPWAPQEKTPPERGQCCGMTITLTCATTVAPDITLCQSRRKKRPRRSGASQWDVAASTTGLSWRRPPPGDGCGPAASPSELASARSVSQVVTGRAPMDAGAGA